MNRNHIKKSVVYAVVIFFIEFRENKLIEVK